MIKVALGYTVIILLFILWYAYVFSNAIIFQPPPPGYKDSDKILKLKTADGAVISAIYLPNSQAKYTLLVSHGNAEDIGYLLPFLQEFRDHGFSVFAYDYHGYGTSTGKPSEKKTYLDIDTAYDYLTKTLHIPPNRIIAYGRSVGGAVALDLAVRKPVAGLILESLFVSAFRVMTVVPILPFDKYSNLKKITKMRSPILVIHGKSDRIIPFWHGEKLYQMAPEPKMHLWVVGAGHNDLLWVAGGNYWKSVAKFVHDYVDKNKIN